MNETQLRDRLHAATADVTPQTPAPQALRRVAHHRRRRTQTVLASLVVLVLAAAGVGLGFGLHGRPAPVQALTQRTADVTVPCTSGAVTLTVGQTLAVAPCPDSEGHAVGPVPFPEAHPFRTVPQPFHFDRPGTFSLAIQYTGCADSVRSCLFNLRRFGMIKVTVVTGEAPAPVQLSCDVTRAAFPRGTSFDLQGCPPTTTATVNGAAVSMVGPLAFRADAVGTATIDLTEPTACQLDPTATCPALALVHALIITVSPSTSTAPSSPPPLGATLKGPPPVLVPSTPPVSLPPRERALPCTTAASLEIPEGETLVLTDCPVDAQVTSSGPALSRSGYTFTARATGSATIHVAFAACDLVSTAVKRSGCAGGPAEADISVTVIGPVASGSPVR